jgi:hypothetical protein
MASAVVLAAVAAPLDSTVTRSLVTLVNDDGDVAARNLRLAEYLNMTKAPTRELLMRELVRGEHLCTRSSATLAACVCVSVCVWCGVGSLLSYGAWLQLTLSLTHTHSLSHTHTPN